MGALIFGEQRIQHLTLHLALGSREARRNALTEVVQWGAGPIPPVVSILLVRFVWLSCAPCQTSAYLSKYQSTTVTPKQWMD